MAERNGYLVIVEQDINPNSPTYNQTREREVYDTDSCPLPNADYQLVDEFCETDADTGARTGWKILVYQDLNINSPTYLQTYQDRIQDETTCDVQTVDPAWEVISETCEIITYGSGKTGNSGYYIVTYQDMNSLSPTYNTTYEDKIYNTTDCPAPDITPNWFTLSSTCKTINIDGVIYGDGTANIVQIDRNEYSPSWNEKYNLYKKSLVEHPLLVTAGDIRQFCMKEFSEIAARVEVKQGFLVSGAPGGGLVRTTDVFFYGYRHQKKTTGTDYSRYIKEVLQEHSPATFNYRIIIK